MGRLLSIMSESDTDNRDAGERRQKTMCLRFERVAVFFVLAEIEAATQRLRSVMSDGETLDQQAPGRWSVVAPGADVTASTWAPGRGPPSGALAARAGIAAHSRALSAVEAPIRMIG